MAFTISYNIKAIDQFTATAAKISHSATSIDKTMRAAAKASNIASRSFGKLRDNSVAASGATKTLDSASRKATRQVDEARRATDNLTKSNKMAARSEKDLAKQTKKAEQAFKKQVAMIKTVGHGLSNTGRLITTRVALPMIGAGIAAIKMSMDFNKGLANVGTLIPGQTERLRGFKKEILDLSVQTGTSANVITKGLYQVISALGESENNMSQLRIATRAAKAGVAETSDAINLLSGVSSTYGDTSDEMLQKVSDLAFQAVELGVTTFPELAASMGRTTTLAKTMGITVEELFGNYAALTSGTDNTAEVSTRLAAVMGELMRGGGDLAKIYKKLGVKSGAELVKSTGGLNQALFALREEVGDNDVAFQNLFGRKEAQIAALSLTGAKAKEAAREIKAMKDAVGATDAAYKAQTEGINKSGHSWDQTKAKIFRMAVTLGDKLLPKFDKFIDKIGPIIDRLSDVDDGSFDAAIAFGEFALKAGLVFLAVGKIMRVSAGFQSFISSASKDMGGLSRNSDAAATNVDKVSGKLTKMQKGVALLGAAAMGYSLGQLAQQALIDPAVKESERTNLSAANLAAQTQRDIRRMNIEQMKSRLVRHEAKREKQASMGGFIDWVTDMDEYSRAVDTTATAIGRLKYEINKAEQSQARSNLATKATSPASAASGAAAAAAGAAGGGAELYKATMAAQKVQLEITVKTDGNAEAEVKTKSKNAYAKVNTGENKP